MPLSQEGTAWAWGGSAESHAPASVRLLQVGNKSWRRRGGGELGATWKEAEGEEEGAEPTSQVWLRKGECHLVPC